MEEEKEEVKHYLSALQKMKTDRQTYDSTWQEVADLMFPRRDFTTTRTEGQKRTPKIYDSTALHSLEQLASGLHGMLTPPSSKWAALRIKGNKETPDDRRWLDMASNYLFDVFSSPDSLFATSTFEFYCDLIAFGNAAMSVTFKKGQIIFNSEPLATCYTRENELGKTDTVYLCRKYSPIEVIRSFGEANVHPKVAEAYRKNVPMEIEVLQVIEPRDAHYGRGAVKDKKPYKSCFIDILHKHMMREDGFDDFPFMFSRWSKRAGETYGYGPAVAAISEARQLNTMVEIMTRAAAKNTDPPLLSPAEGMILPLRLDAGAINYYNPDLGEPKFWQNGFQPNYFDTLIEQKRILIQKMFYVDWLNLPELSRMTTVEVNQRTQDSLRQLSPMLSRLGAEFLSPLIQRTLFLAIDNNLLPKPPASSQGKEVSIDYTSPMAVAQRAVQANAVLQGLTIGAQLAQFDQSVPMHVNAPAIFRDQLLKTFSWPQNYLRDEEEVQQMKEKQDEATAAAQQGQVAESYSKSAKNVAGAVNDLQGTQ